MGGSNRLLRLRKKVQAFLAAYDMAKRCGYQVKVYQWNGHIVLSLEREIRNEWHTERIVLAKIMIDRKYVPKIPLPPELYKAIREYWSGREYDA